MNGGQSEQHERLEQLIATSMKCDRAILFSSGYQANLAVLTLLGAIRASVFIDKGMHASVYDGLKLGNVDFKRYRHDDIEHLKTNSS